jgi:predicted CXXCH cytochrome family protein
MKGTLTHIQAGAGRDRLWGMVLSVSILGVATLWSTDSAFAQAPPHWESTSIVIDCTSQCHLPHQAQGGQLAQAAGNVALCQSCHNSSGLAADLPINSSDRAIPGTHGTSHAFDVAAIHAAYETQLPLDTEMQLRVMGGNVVCSTCHNQHSTTPAFGGTPRVGRSKQITALGSTGSVSSGGTFSGPEGVWYLIEVSQAGTQATARFQYSKDNGISFFPEQIAGTDVPLDNGVTISFGAGDYVVGERWEFAASYPFLRAAIDFEDNATGDRFCRDCHRSWMMEHSEVENWDGGFKSHPVGQVLGANAQGYDRTVPLDGNGADQGSGGADSNPTNDLALDAAGNLQCLTCHGVHYVDSNTLTVDGP